jgi:hypothetical protein
MAQLIKRLFPDAVTGGTLARGYMDPDYITLMRALVVLLEFAVFVPGYLRLLTNFSHPQVQKNKYALLMAVLVVPPVVFVDHGHFQFN